MTLMSIQLITTGIQGRKICFIFAFKSLPFLLLFYSFLSIISAVLLDFFPLYHEIKIMIVQFTRSSGIFEKMYFQPF